MKEDTANELRQTSDPIDKKPRWDKFKRFFSRHKKKIAIAGLGAATVGGAFLVCKNPEIVEKVAVGVKERFDCADRKGFSQTIGATVEKSNTFMSAEELCNVADSAEEKQEAEETLSAARLGKMIGLTAQEVNRRLCALGYLKGEPNNWQVTPKGEAVSVEFATRSYPCREWSKSIIQELGDPEAYRETVNRNRALAGLEPLEKTA